MARSKRLSPIKKLAENKQKVSAVSLGDAIKHLAQMEERLEQLQRYKREYQNQTQTQTQSQTRNQSKQTSDLQATRASHSNLTGQKLQQYYQFLTQLDAAISQQKQIVLDAKLGVSSKQLDWQNHHNRTSAVTKVIQKMRSNEERAKDKKEAALMDEMSTQAFVQRHSK